MTVVSVGIMMGASAARSSLGFVQEVAITCHRKHAHELANLLRQLG